MELAIISIILQKYACTIQWFDSPIANKSRSNIEQYNVKEI